MVPFLFAIVCAPKNDGATPARPESILWAKTARGNGEVRDWAVNDISNRVRVRFRTGRTVVYRLRQYEYRSGDDVLLSILPVGRGRLLVTHNHGDYIVDLRGRVAAELKEGVAHREYIVANGRGRLLRAGETPFEEPGWQVARGWNGKTILTSYAEPKAMQYVVLLDVRLNRLAAYRFEDGKIESVRSTPAGWSVWVRRHEGSHRYELPNDGSSPLRIAD